MTARADHHQPAVAKAEAGRVLVPMLVRLRLAGEFVGAEMVVHIGVHVAADAVLDPVFDPSIRQHVLDTGARHDAGGEGVVFDDDRRFGQHQLDIERLQLAAVEHAEINEGAVGSTEETVAKIVLAAGI